MTNKLEDLAKELQEKIEGIKYLHLISDGSIVDIIMEYGIKLEDGTEKKYCEIAHIRKRKYTEKFDFTYLSTNAMAYDTLIDSEVEKRISKSLQLTKMKNELSKILGEVKKLHKKEKNTSYYSNSFEGRDVDKEFSEVRDSMLFFTDVFIDKAVKFGRSYETGEKRRNDK